MPEVKQYDWSKLMPDQIVKTYNCLLYTSDAADE